MEIEKWLAQIDRNTQVFTETFGRLDNDQLNWKPLPHIWSIAQNIEHLITVNRSYRPPIVGIRQGTYEVPFTGKVGFLVRFFGKMILNSVKPDNVKKIKTFPVWEPTSSSLPSNILQQFTESQLELKELVETSLDLLESGAVISSPANRYIVYKVETAFDIITTHQLRHFEQAKEVWNQFQQTNTK